MIDLHSHILPGLDDGADTIADALKIAGQLKENGFDTLIATPHVQEGRDYLHPEQILLATEQVREAAEAAGLALKILPGAENYIFPDLPKWAAEGKLMTLGNQGGCLLVELPMAEIPAYTDQVFFELQVQGITPVLAHPERYRRLSEIPDQLLDWARKGILFQIDLRSLSGRYGPHAARLAERMLASNLVHFLGSDAHRITGKESYREALRKVSEIAGPERFREITSLNPVTILEGKSLENPGDYAWQKAKKKKSRRIWKWFSKDTSASL